MSVAKFRFNNASLQFEETNPEDTRIGLDFSYRLTAI